MSRIADLFDGCENADEKDAEEMTFMDITTPKVSTRP